LKPWRIGDFRWAAFVLVLILTGCAKGPPEDVKLRGEIVTAPNANPDVDGAASPVLVIVYQLANVDTFANGDFFSLYDPDGAALGADLLAREQMTVQPGETRQFSADFDPESAALGVIVAFRDIENASWKSVAEFPKLSLMEKVNVFKKQKLVIEIDSLSVTATIGK
jgi:type VI secretion system protein VasD